MEVSLLQARKSISKKSVRAPIDFTSKLSHYMLHTASRQDDELSQCVETYISNNDAWWVDSACSAESDQRALAAEDWDALSCECGVPLLAYTEAALASCGVDAGIDWAAVSGSCPMLSLA